MICVTIAQDSRRLALADLLNAGRRGDLIEIRLDRFKKAPEVGQLIAAKPKPVILSCRRARDGGEWTGTEDERLALLRQCIVSKADYVEIEVDVADKIRKLPPTRRVISYTNFEETPADVADVYAEAQRKGADVVKLSTRTRTPEEAWPLVKILARPAVPTVVAGLGKPGIMLSILARKMGAPWTYAALERGMETYPGQPTVNQLLDVYAHADIGRTTPLVGVSGLTEAGVATAGLLNAAFAELGRPERCLPLAVGGTDVFRKVIKAIKLSGVVVDPPHWEAMREIAADLRGDARQAGATDLICRHADRWRGFDFFGRAAVGALEDVVDRRSGGKPLAGRRVAVVGADAAARMVGHRVRRRGGVVIIAARDREAARTLAAELDGRHVPLEGLYTTQHEVLVVCADERQRVTAPANADEPSIHPGYLTADMTVMDVTATPFPTPVLVAAERHGCRIVPPAEVLLRQVGLYVRAITDRSVADETLRPVLERLVERE